MSSRWKIYVVVNYVALIAFTAIFGMLVWFAVTKGLTNNDLVTFIPVLAGLFLMLTNSLLNLFIYYRYFPSTVLSKGIKILFLIQTSLFTISLLAMLVLVIAGINEEFGRTNDDDIGLIMLAILCPLLLIAIYIFIHQVIVIRFLKMNYKKTLKEQIESIGLTQE